MSYASMRCMYWYDMNEIKGKWEMWLCNDNMICEYKMYTSRYDMVKKYESNMWNENVYVLHDFVWYWQQKWN